MAEDASQDDRLAEARELTQLVHDVAERARETFSAAVGGLGLTSAMGRALLLLPEPLPMREIADGLACDPSYVTGVADDLERAGLARRATGTDRRVTLLALTPAGHERRREVERVVASSALVLRLSPARRRQLRSALRALVDRS